MFEKLTDEQIKMLACLLDFEDFPPKSFTSEDWSETAANIEGELEQELTKRNLWPKKEK